MKVKTAVLIGLLLILIVLVSVTLRRCSAPPHVEPPAVELGESALDPASQDDEASAGGTDPAPAARPVSAGPGVRVRPRALTPARHHRLLERIEGKLRGDTTGASGTAEPAPIPEGKLSADYIRGAVREIAPLFKECYQMALRRQPDLSGKVVVRFEIMGDPELGGLVADSHVQEERSDLQDEQLRECVQETMYALELKAPEEGGRVTVNYPLIFKAGKSDKDQEQ